MIVLMARRQHPQLTPHSLPEVNKKKKCLFPKIKSQQVPLTSKDSLELYPCFQATASKLSLAIESEPALGLSSIQFYHVCPGALCLVTPPAFIGLCSRASGSISFL